MDVVRGDEIHFKLEHLKELHLAGQDLLLGKGSMADLLRNDLRMEWVDVFILGGKIHSPNSNQMHIRILEHLCALHRSDEVVKDSDCQEVRSDCAFE